MTSAVLVDTTALYGVFAPSDEHHREAVTCIQDLRAHRTPLMTTATVLVESYVLAHARLGRAGLMRFRAGVADSTWLQVRPVSSAQEGLAWRLLEQYEDKDWSFVDATSFVVMRALKLRRAFTFDRHFAQAGFEMVPGR